MTLGKPDLPADGTAPTTERGHCGAIGGAIAMAATTDRLFERIEADPEIGHCFADRSVATHRRHVATLLGQAHEGSACYDAPDCYDGPDVADAHAHLAVSDRDFDVLVGHIASTLDELAIAEEMGVQVVNLIARLRPLVVNPAA